MNTERSHESDLNKSFKDFVSLRGVVVAIIGIFTAGILSVVSVTSYLDARADEKFYKEVEGRVLESRVRTVEDGIKKNHITLDTIQLQQNQLLMGIGEIKGKLDGIGSN